MSGKFTSDEFVSGQLVTYMQDYSTGYRYRGVAPNVTRKESGAER